jgi:hypothetical protein
MLLLGNLGIVLVVTRQRLLPALVLPTRSLKWNSKCVFFRHASCV